MATKSKGTRRRLSERPAARQKARSRTPGGRALAKIVVQRLKRQRAYQRVAGAMRGAGSFGQAR
jgi:hypothetical protein